MTKDLMSRVNAEREQSLKFYEHWDYIGEEVWIPGRSGKIRTLFYHSENSQNDMPVFFDIHGGGHTVHKAEADQPFCRKLCNAINGLVISIDYHLAPEYQWPSQLYEVYDVILHVYKNAEQYHIDPQRIGIGGHSAGGNLAAAAVLLANEKKDFVLKCQILDYPEVDLAKSPVEKYEGRAKNMIEQLELFNECYLNAEHKYDPCFSPLYASKEQLIGLPPAVFVLCGEDILYREGMQYAFKLAETGVETVIRLFPDAVHGFTADYYYTSEGQEGIQFMIREIKKYL